MKSTELFVAFLITTVWIWIIPVVTAADIHVPGDQPTIQAGIDAAGNGDTVIVADGTYTGNGNKNLDTLGKAITIRSENGADACIIDCEADGRGFIIQTGETSETIIEGLTVRDGHGDEGGAAYIANGVSPVFRQCAFLSSTASVAGGAIFILENAKPAFRNCLFQYNTSVYAAGAVYAQNSSPGFSDCQFLNNHCGNDGGALFIEGSNIVDITDCLFRNNTGGTGAGVCVYGNAIVTLTSCTLQDNSGNNGGGLACREYADVTMNGCTVYNNDVAFDGGGICVELSASISIDNCDIGTNSADNDGGGIYFSGDGTQELTGSTVSSNSAHSGGGIACLFGASPVLNECIIIGNSANIGGGVSVTSATPEILDCTIRQNSAEKGGGLIAYDSSGWVKQCLFQDNYAVEEGGAIYCSDNCATVFGGSTENANQFSGNLAGFGADLFAKIIPETPINATDNTFQGCPETEYFVAPAAAFDVTGCQAGFTPLTQDVYVSTTGNDGNNGLTPDTPFKTIRYALSHIKASDSNPITVHMAPGTYSYTTTGETFPVPLLSHVHVTAQPEEPGGVTATLEGSEEFQLLRARHTAGAKLSQVILFEGRASDGGALYSKDSSWTLDSVTLRSNEADQRGGAIYCVDSTGVINHCIFQDNSAEHHGGALGSDRSTLTLGNCLMTTNSAGVFGGTVHLDESTLDFLNCTISANSAVDSGGALHASGESSLTMMNSIAWGDTPDELSGDFLLEITYSDVQDLVGGTGNIDSDPLFCTGPGGDYYLSHTAAGQSVDSPCIDAGSAPASDITAGDIALDQLTTRTDTIPDAGTVDMGFHRPDLRPCTTLGCTIEMPADLFRAGDDCYCKVIVCNPGAETFTDIPVFAILDVYGELFFAPEFNEFSYYTESLNPGETGIWILNHFNWPQGAGSASGIYWYAAMTDPEITELFGDWDMFQFGWTNS